MDEGEAHDLGSGVWGGEVGRVPAGGLLREGAVLCVQLPADTRPVTLLPPPLLTT